MKAMQMVRLPIPSYDAEIVLLHGTTSAMAAIVADERIPTAAFVDFVASDDEVLYGSTSDVCGGTGDVRRSVYVFIESTQSPEEKRGTLVHEMFHAVVRLMGDIGQTITPKSDEPAAYLLEWAVREASKACRLR
jgi:hypothetical protein